MIIKNNALTDPAMIRALYRASQAGVDDRPDRPRRLLPAARASPASANASACARSSGGSSSTRASTSSRTAATPEVYIGSADLMERNLDRRVETLCRCATVRLLRHIRDVVLDAYLRDNDRAYVLLDARYTKEWRPTVNRARMPSRR